MQLASLAQKIMDSYAREYIERANAIIAQKVVLANNELNTIKDEKIHDLFNEAISDFYSDYTPISGGYDRESDGNGSGGLYSLLKTSIEIDGDVSGLQYWFDDSDFTTYRSGYRGAGDLYEKVFELGWHGGADSIDGSKAGTYGLHPRPGTPYWRTPLNVYSRWGRPARVASISPEDDFYQRFDTYVHGEMVDQFKTILDRHLSGISDITHI